MHCHALLFGILIALGLGGCQSTNPKAHDWTRGGTGFDERDKDARACRRWASRKLLHEQGYIDPFDKPYGSELRQMMDRHSAKIREDALFGECMRSRGYLPKSAKTGPASKSNPGE